MITHSSLTSTGIRHGFFTREGGCSEGIFASLNCGLGSGDNRDHIVENRRRVSHQLGVLPAHLVSAYQVHGKDVLTVSKPWSNDETRPKADGMVTNVPGLALGILTADCGPLLFADDAAGVIGACHAGWKGALRGVAISTVEAMEKLGARRNQITVVIGPTISSSAYEVGPEFPVPFLQAGANNERHFVRSKRPGHHMFDLPSFLSSQLLALGLKSVTDIGLCTYGDERRFFSYRRSVHNKEPDYGRLISAIALEAN